MQQRVSLILDGLLNFSSRPMEASVLSFSIARFIVLALVIFKLPQLANFAFCFNAQEEVGHSYKLEGKKWSLGF